MCVSKKGILLFLLSLSLGGRICCAGIAQSSGIFPLRLGNEVLRVEVAFTEAEHRQGLMHRITLPEDRGMLFVFEFPQALQFWMKDTPLPLDVGFFTADGVLREYYAMRPYDRTSVRSLRDDLSFALEVNQGWFAAHGVQVGQRFDPDLLRALLEARGLDPAHIDLP